MRGTKEESPADNVKSEPGGGSDASTEPLSRRDRRLLGSIADFLGIVDLVAVMMVIATVCTAIATWRTASIATAIYMASERPYMGVSSVDLGAQSSG